MMDFYGADLSEETLFWTSHVPLLLQMSWFGRLEQKVVSSCSWRILRSMEGSPVDGPGEAQWVRTCPGLQDQSWSCSCLRSVNAQCVLPTTLSYYHTRCELHICKAEWVWAVWAAVINLTKQEINYKYVLFNKCLKWVHLSHPRPEISAGVCEVTGSWVTGLCVFFVWLSENKRGRKLVSGWSSRSEDVLAGSGRFWQVLIRRRTSWHHQRVNQERGERVQRRIKRQNSLNPRLLWTFH